MIPGKYTLILFLIWAFLGCVSTSYGNDTGDQVLVVYNKSFQGSEDIARHYAEKRNVPENQILGLSMSRSETILRGEYQVNIEEPIAQKLKQNLWMDVSPKPGYNYARTMASTFTLDGSYKIKYIVLCRGVPLKIREDAAVAARESNSTFASGLKRNQASVDSELATLPMRTISPLRTGFVPNIVFAQKEKSNIHPKKGVLMVTRLDGPTHDIAKSLVDKAMKAEENGLFGHVYVDTRGLKSGPYLKGDVWMNQVAKISKLYGFPVHEDSKKALIKNDEIFNESILYSGWYSQHPQGIMKDGQVEFVDGAFAYHLHSYSASTVRSEEKNWVGPLLAKGASVTMGSVYEPFLEYTPNMGVFWDRILAGFNVGQAAYVSMNALSWQTVVIGDPLYQPFKKEISSWHHDYKSKKSSLMGNTLYSLVLSREDVQRMPPFQVVMELTRHSDFEAALNTSSFLNEQLISLGKDVFSNRELKAYYERSFRLSKSPAQKVNLALKYVKFLEKNDEPELAIKVYQFIIENSDIYKQKNNIIQSLLDLTQRFGQPRDFEFIKSNNLVEGQP